VNHTLDIFKRLSHGQPEWVEAVEALEEARIRIANLSSKAPVEYFISVADQSVVVSSQVTSRSDPDRYVSGSWSHVT
jgi:hypothetical protein